MQEKFTLKISSAVVVDGEIKRPGSIVHLDERTAKDFLRRGKAVLATEADGIPAADAEAAPAADEEPGEEAPAEADAEAAKPRSKKK